MKKVLFLIGLIAMSCGPGKKAVQSSDIPEKRPDGLVAVADNSKRPADSDKTNTAPTVLMSNSTAVGEILNYLASDSLGGRDSGSEGIEIAAQYIESYFEDHGVERYFESYRDTLANYNTISYNMVGLVPGNDKELAEEFIVIGAHYDHIGFINSATTDSIANGANDNASGTTTVLELARYFGAKRSNRRSLLFVLFSAEEKGLLGSTHLADRLKNEDFNLYVMLNFEMTGVPMQDKDYLMYLSGYERSNLAEVCNKYAGENLVGFLPQAKQFSLFMRSDNFPFHKAFGVPSQTYCTFDFTNYEYYHKVEDEAFRMDFEHMTRVINKMIPVIEGISNADEQEISYN